jgi:hypothetical protein
VKLVFKTNLDEPQRDVWEINDKANDGVRLAPVPRVGERISFPFKRWDHLAKREGSFSYELEVCAIAYDFHARVVHVELHMPSYYKTMSIHDWSEWFKRHRFGRGEPATHLPSPERGET